MSDQFTQSGSTDGTTSVTVTLNGVAAGAALVAFGWDGNGGSTASVSDAQGSYTAQATTAGPDGNSVFGKAFVLENANAGTHAATLTVTGGNGCFLVLAEVNSSGAGATSGENAASQNAPGGATDAISSGTVTVTGNCTLIAMSSDTADVSVVDEPSIGTGFTSRNSGDNGTIGSWTLESKGVAANAAGTFTAIIGASQYITLAVAIKNNAGGATFNPGWAYGATKTIGGVS